MRGIIGSTLVAALSVGCSAAPEDVAAESQAVMRCPDPKNGCTVSNGAGIYTDEYGAAGFGASQIMITHFINHWPGVTFDARYFDNASSWWLALPSQGTVTTADFNGQNGLAVVSVTETATVPTWNMKDSHGNPVSTQAPADFLQLTLHVRVADPNGGPKEYALTFDGTGVFTKYQVNIRKFNMLWRAEDAPQVPPKQYCLDGNGVKDQVVFQEMIGVDPVDGSVSRNGTSTNYVTLSCLLGAPAKAHSWGYPYRPGYAANVLFDGAIHMKRASYCGDGSFYTKTGTEIHIRDVDTINDAPMGSTPEAYWTSTRAYCYWPANMRHPEMGFNGTCADGTTIPQCTGLPQPPSGMWLEDGSIPPSF
ncbi:MAG TPA: ADYC domain-containing protein [Polyangia bacterium]